MVVWIDGRLDGVLDQFLECSFLADELDEFGDAATTAKHDQLFLLKKEFLDGATFLLIQQLIDLDVASR